MQVSPVIRVLLIDDSVVVRRLVTNALDADPQIQVVATAGNGRTGLQKLEQIETDIVILDVEMPELGGLETLTEIRKRNPRLPVIMFSSRTRKGAISTLEALSLGASDYVTKPESARNPDDVATNVWDQLIAKIKAVCKVPVSPNVAAGLSQAVNPSVNRRADAPATRPAPLPNIGRTADLIVIAASTGGPNALCQVISSLPGNLGAPVLIVQHMPPVFTGLLAERLDARSELVVREAVQGQTIQPGEVWIAPGDFHMEVVRRQGTSRIELHQGPQENSCRPAADVLFRSAAQTYGPNVLAVVMTGMGQDGFKGSMEIREHGGSVLAQDELTSVVWGMPGFVANAGLAERVLPLDAIASAIVTKTRPMVRARTANMG